MTHPIDGDQPDPDTWRLTLDEGETLEVSPAGTPDPDRPVGLRLPTSRAYDLSVVLDAYTTMVELVERAADVSGTEQSLARGLRDAATVAGRKPRPGNGVGRAARPRAVARLQAARPELSHSTVTAVIDAVAWLTDQDRQYDARGVLDAVAGDDPGGAVFLTLYGRPGPADRPGADA